MPAPYRAENLGGLHGSGVYNDTRPVIDVGSVIDSASRAFANTREGVLHRALLQQAADRENRQQAVTAAGQGVYPDDVADRLAAGGGMVDDTSVGAPQPTAPAPAPSPIASAMTAAPLGPATAPPPVDASLAGAPGAPSTLAPTSPQLTPPTPAQGTAPPIARPQKPRYTVVRLGNGQSQLIERSPQDMRMALLEARLKEMEAAIPARGEQARQTEGVKQTGRSDLLDQRTDATTERDATKHGFDMEKQQAANAGHLAVAQLRASMKSDPSTMSPQARVNMLGKLADTYVTASSGDPQHALDMADADPTLSSFGTTAKQLQSFIAASVGKWQRGELNTNLRTQGQTFETPEQTAGRIAKTKTIVGGKTSADPTAGMSDADAWEHWKESGQTAAQATARVQGRKK